MAKKKAKKKGSRPAAKKSSRKPAAKVVAFRGLNPEERRELSKDYAESIRNEQDPQSRTELKRELREELKKQVKA